MELKLFRLPVVPLKVLHVDLGELRIPPVHQDVFAVPRGSPIRVVEAAQLDGLTVGNDHLVMVDRKPTR